MIIDFIYETDVVIELDCLSAMELTANLTLETEGFPLDAEISITITDNKTIKELNKKYRKLNKETDVLSFPCHNFTAGDYCCLKPQAVPITLGDIVISIEKASAAAIEYGHTLLREMSFLVCHSILHLLGYDHMSEHDKNVMFAKQEMILTKAGISR